MRKIDDIKNDLDYIDREMINGCYLGGRGDTLSLREKREELENELTLARSVLVASNDELDIYEQRRYKECFIYYVVLHNTYSIVGYVTADYSDGYHVLGNVGYEMFRKYQGNGFARKALELLCDVFLDRGMEMSVIVIEPVNVPSIKTTESFGGVLVKQATSKYGTNIYNVDIKEKVKSRNNG